MHSARGPGALRFLFLLSFFFSFLLDLSPVVPTMRDHSEQPPASLASLLPGLESVRLYHPACRETSFYRPCGVCSLFSRFQLWYKPSFCPCLNSSTFPHTVFAIAIAANKIGRICEAAVFNFSLLFPAAACSMAAQQQSGSHL